MSAFFRILLLLTLPYAIIGQSSNTPLNSSELKTKVDEYVERVKEGSTIDFDSIYLVLDQTLETRDTASFFLLSNSLLRYHFYSKKLFKEGITFALKMVDRLGVASTSFGDFNNGLGNFYTLTDKDELALEHYFKSLEWYKTYDPLKVTIALGNIGQIFYHYEDYENALKYNKEALQYSLLLEDKKERLDNLTYDYFRIAQSYFRLGNLEEAKNYYAQSLAVAKENKNKSQYLLAIMEAFVFFNEIEDVERCRQLIKEGDKVVEQYSRTTHLTQKYTVYKSRYYLKHEQIKLATPPDSLRLLSDEYTINELSYMKDYYRAIDDLPQAMTSYEALLEKMRTSDDRKIQLDNIEEQYDIHELKKLNHQLASVAKNRKKANLLAWGLVGSILMLLLLQFSYFKKEKKLNALLSKKSMELENANSRLLVSNQELERFAHITAHDFKSPLRQIVSFANLAKRKTKDKEESVHEYLTFIEKSGQRLNELVDDILNYSKLYFSEKEIVKVEVDLNAILDEVEMGLTNFMAERNGRIIKNEILPTITANRNAVIALFQNLVENGIKYNESQEPTVEVFCRPSKDYLSIFIKDNGIGIDEKYFEDIFVTFKRLHTPEHYEGTGIGMSICKRAIEQLGGKISLDSEVGVGTTFEIMFPIQTIVTTEEKEVQSQSNLV